MRNLKNILVVHVMLSVIFSCGNKGPAAGSPDEVLYLLKKNGGSPDILGLYSSHTLKYMKQYMKASGMDEQSAINTLSFIDSRAEYEVHNLQLRGDRCSMVVRFMVKGPEKSRGLEVVILMVKENGNWRIDRSDDFKRLLQSQVERGAEKYLGRIR